MANAGCLYSHGGYKILSDPWIVGAPFEGSWCHGFQIKAKPSDFFDVNLIHLTHGHEDHADPATLKEFPKSIPVLIYDHKINFLKRKLLELGFTEIIVMKDKETREFGPFKLTMYGPFIGHPFHETELGNLVDSALVFEAEGKVCFNLNDNTVTEESAQMLLDRHGPPDVAQLVDACASCYPATFTNLTHEQKLSEKNRILNRLLTSNIKCAKIMKAKKLMPFAGRYQLQGPLAELNQYLAVHEPHEVARIYKEAGIEPLLMYEGDEYEF